MGSCRRLCATMCLGLIAGVAVILALDPKTRAKLWKQAIDKSEILKDKFKDYEQRLGKAIDAGKREAEIKQKVLEGQISIEEEKKESPNYIV